MGRCAAGEIRANFAGWRYCARTRYPDLLVVGVFHIRRQRDTKVRTRVSRNEMTIETRR